MPDVFLDQNGIYVVTLREPVVTRSGRQSRPTRFFAHVEQPSDDEGRETTEGGGEDSCTETDTDLDGFITSDSEEDEDGLPLSGSEVSVSSSSTGDSETDTEGEPLYIGYESPRVSSSPRSES